MNTAGADGLATNTNMDDATTRTMTLAVDPHIDTTTMAATTTRTTTVAIETTTTALIT